MALKRNEQLRAILAKARWSYEGLARRVNALGVEHGLELIYDKSSVSHWIQGKRPRGRVAYLIAEVLSRQLGRSVTPAEIGLDMAAAKDIAASSMLFQPSRTEALDTMTELGRADLDRQDHLRSLLFSAAAFAGIQRDWLLHMLGAKTHDGTKIDSQDVTGLAEMAQFFIGIDNKLGGGQARSAIISYLTNDAVPLLRRAAPDDLKQELYAMVGQLFLSAGWMTYDVGSIGLAQRYFTQALYLAREAGPRGLTLGGQILSASSHLAIFSGDPREGLALAQGAVHTAEKSGSRATLMRSYLMTARAHATLGDERAASSAMSQAELVNEKKSFVEEEQWLAFQDEHFLASHLSACFAELDDATKMLEHAQRSAAGPRGRRSVISDILIARAKLRLGDLNEACQAAIAAANAAGTLRSYMAQSATRDLVDELRQHNSATARETVEEINRIIAGAAPS